MRFDQKDHDLRCEWGLPGVLALAPVSDAIVVVDILSFSTAVDVAPYFVKDRFVNGALLPLG